jgi:hypothetical protein
MGGREAMPDEYRVSMGLAIPTIQLLLSKHKERRFEGPLLTLGRQAITANADEILSAFVHMGLQPEALPEKIRHQPVIRNDQYLFGLMGLEMQAMDVSDYEGAEVLHDLNVPLPEELRGKFRTVIDGGTFEHVFDIRTAFANIVDLVEPGGRVMHLSPCNNYVNHGFWQLSPRVFYDFYTVNQFTDLQTTMIVHPRDTDSPRAWRAFPFDPRGPAGAIAFFTNHEDRLDILFSAIKTEKSTSTILPIQAFDDSVPTDLTPSLGDEYTLELTDERLNVRCVRHPVPVFPPTQRPVRGSQ